MGIHCGKTTISTFKMLMHSNLGEYFELGELRIHCGKTAISNFKMLMHSNLVGTQYNFCCCPPTKFEHTITLKLAYAVLTIVNAKNI